jgi:cytochrome c oxidase subunit 1
MYSEFWARISFVFIFLGFNVTFFPQFILGAMGMPRRYFDYDPVYEGLNRISSVGAWTIGIGFLVGGAVIIHGLLRGEKAPDNPWGAKTLEWQTSSPPPHENFLVEPVVTAGPYEYR